MTIVNETGIQGIETENAIAEFSAYTDELEKILFQFPNPSYNDQNWFQKQIPAVLNGETTLALQQLVPLKIRKSAGIFFTGSKLAEKISTRLAPLLSNGAKIIDPACGAGNLLIACAKYLPRGKNFESTLSIWSEKIYGCDLHYEFVRSVQIRLTLLAASLHDKAANTNADLNPGKIFPGIKVCDSLKSKSLLDDFDCVVVNPPFAYTNAPTECQWAHGRVQVAGIFFEKIIKAAPEAQRIVGILPDVLRSGTRYRKWREMIADVSKTMDIEIAGLFDDKTDVDVFIIDVIKKSNPGGRTILWPSQGSNIKSSSTVSNFFNVHVGPVVPHRDPETGSLYPYIHARNATDWQILSNISEFRRYPKRVFSPPFVVIHRTSSPRDKFRCIGAVVNEKRDIAVENHLVVFLPRDKKLESCLKLVEVLNSPETNDWLNNRIRCRHLTVSALADLPYN
jgi:SAM-dependent methyltransferase